MPRFSRSYFGLDDFDASLRVVPNTVFKDHNVAGLGDREVRLGGDDHAERLQFGGDVNTRLVVLDLNFTEIGRTPFRRDGPENVGEIFGAELRRWRQPIELRVDVDIAFLPLDLRAPSASGESAVPVKSTFVSPFRGR